VETYDLVAVACAARRALRLCSKYSLRASLLPNGAKVDASRVVAVKACEKIFSILFPNCFYLYDDIEET
jgi:hypothetical protein